MRTLLQETLELRDRYDDEPAHSDHVTHLALEIFDALKVPLKLDDRARELLRSGALLHDIGWSQTVQGKGHHKESARLIRAQKWESLTAAEVLIVAQIARYHRRSIPKEGHEDFFALPAADQRTVWLLGGILRIADALDRTHTQRLKKVAAEETKEEITIQCSPRGTYSEEKSIFELKRNMLEAATSKKLRWVGHEADGETRRSG